MNRTRLLSYLLLIGLAVGGLGFGVARLNAATPALFLQLPTEALPATGTVDVSIHIVNAANLGAWEFDLHYDPAFLTVQGMTLDPALGVEFSCDAKGQRCALALGPITEQQGIANVGAVTYGQTGGLSGDSILAVLHLAPTGQGGATTLSLANALVADANARPTVPTVQGGVLTLQSDTDLFLPSVTK